MSRKESGIDYKNFVEVLQDKQGEKKGIFFLTQKENQLFLSYHDLYNKALNLLYFLQKWGLKPGDQLILQINNNYDFVCIFWACILGKIIPVPATLAENDEYRLKLCNICQVLKRPYLITDAKHLESLKDFISLKGLKEIFAWVSQSSLLLEKIEDTTEKGEIYMPQESDTAFIQFSSGSTGDPKGVILTHKNLLTNIKAILKGIQIQNSDKSFSWMPLTHDMGIIGFHLSPTVANLEQFLMSTQLFIRYPDLWLKKISESRSTITCSPNFGYQYLLKYLHRLEESLDLSSVRLILNGAEPIDHQLCYQFLDELAPFGLKPNVIFPVYGLAEAALGVSFSKPGEKIRVTQVARGSLNIGEKVKEKTGNTDVVSFVEVGLPIENCCVKLVDQDCREVEDRTVGHILIKGDNVTSGYYNNKEANLNAFTPDGWLRTGDLGFQKNGRLYITGRSKDIIIVNGQNFYPHDIERVAEELEGIGFGKVAVCDVYDEVHQRNEIICFVVFKNNLEDLLLLYNKLKQHIAEKIGIEITKMIPVKQVPKTTSGKPKRYKLKEMYQQGVYNEVLQKITALTAQDESSREIRPEYEVRQMVTTAWKQVLNLEAVGLKDNFFDLGGSSVQAVQLKSKLEAAFGKVMENVALFKYTTIDSQVKYLMGQKRTGGAAKGSQIKKRRERFKQDAIENKDSKGQLDIALVGMAGRFPGAKNIEEFWENLKNGVESISIFSDEELTQCGIDLQLLNDTNYVKAKGTLEDLEYFDAPFFGYSSPEAETLDPQVRIFHECIWEALEDAGYDVENYDGLIGLYAGASPNHSWEFMSGSFEPNNALRQFVQVQLNDKDFMSTRISYKLNLKGPSFTMYTGCSTSSVAVDFACQGLITGRCDMAAAGGISIWLPKNSGYLYAADMLFSSDGKNRSFDERANGTVFSDGAGVVVLKLLTDAIADNDHIYAVIKGSAVNNDGNRKIGYTAPSLEGQAEAILEAQQRAGVSPESISYVETHGAATTLGDPIEIEALKEAFNTNKKGFCAIGSVKTNIGHLNVAAGIAGLIKTALALKYKLIPPSLHFETSNPKIDFRNSPFYVNTALNPWKNEKYPLRAGISSFGIGGTNSHVILEAAPEEKDSAAGRKWKLLLLSARTKQALDEATENLTKYFRRFPGIKLADAAYTLQVGRRAWGRRRMVVCSTIDEAITSMTPGSGKVFTSSASEEDKHVVFVFSGLGSQYVDMGLDLYNTEPVFRREMDRCFDILKRLQARNMKEILYPGGGTPTFPPPPDLNRTEIVQSLLFTFEYALARLLMNWGIKPWAMIGYSLGEYATACLAGIFSLEDALELVVLRGKLTAGMSAGAMLSVPIPKEELKPLLEEFVPNPPVSDALGEEHLSLAIDNGPTCVVAGPTDLIDAFATFMKAKRYLCIRVQNTRAMHSPMMTPISEKLTERVKEMTLNQPVIPYISNVTGKWMTNRLAKDPGYWGRHLRQTVQFADGIKELVKDPDTIFLEIGPGRDLSLLIRNYIKDKPEKRILNMVRYAKEEVTDSYYLLSKIGLLWLYGISLDWEDFYSEEKRKRISLPTYPFQREFYWLESKSLRGGVRKHESALAAVKRDIADFFYTPSWKLTPLPLPSAHLLDKQEKQWNWLIFTDESTLGSQLVNKLKRQSGNVVTVKAGEVFYQGEDGDYTINPTQDTDYKTLFKQLRSERKFPYIIVHLWSLTRDNKNDEVSRGKRVETAQNMGFYSLLYMARTAGMEVDNNKLQIMAVTNHIVRVTGEDRLSPEKVTILGPVKVIPIEYQNISCRSIDILLPPSGSSQEEKLVEQLMEEFTVPSDEPMVALRNHSRYVQVFDSIRPGHPEKTGPILKKQGVYFITGGLGGIGLALAEELARSVQAKLVLTGRSPFPPEEEREKWLASHHEQESTVIKIKKIRELEQAGAEILVLSADVTDEEGMQKAIRQAEKHFGKINGVIHAAGLPDGGLILGRTKEMSERVLAAKVMGTLVLDTLFKDADLDFFVLCSSTAAILPPPGQVAYCAANAFLDAFAHSKIPGDAVPTISINWDRWRQVGVAKIAETKHKQLVGDELEGGITKEEGIEAFTRILNYQLPQIVVSPRDLRNITWQLSVAKDYLSANEVETLMPVRTLHRRPELSVDYVEPGNDVERQLAHILQNFFGIDKVGIHDNFFDLGATSLDIIQVNHQLKKWFDKKISVVTMYSYPTIALLAEYLSEEDGYRHTASGAMDMAPNKQEKPGRGEPQKTAGTGREIAIIGMAGRFPGAKSIGEFWNNLIQGRESISFFSKEELEASDEDREAMSHTDYVMAKPVLEDIEYFDAAFFGYSPKEAEITSPQTRIALECAWDALEDAGYDSNNYNGDIGLFMGGSFSIFWEALANISAKCNHLGEFETALLSGKDFLSTRISYKLNLKGPSINLFTSCSTSGVAIHLACQSLLSGDCHMALAGGVSIWLPHKKGYLYQEGMIFSKDGHCRPFDAGANGILLGNGAGTAVLKPLANAVADRDYIYCVIKGTAINNDGNRKVGWTAPSTEGEAAVIRAAHQNAGVDPETISYIEAHATGTVVGDPIEMEALMMAFHTNKKGFCRIGSVKGNVGHLDAASGITGVLKTALALKNKLIPPTIHFTHPNPNIDFENSPFKVNAKLKKWKNNHYPLRAGVNSFGMGGTNIHIVMEEAPGESETEEGAILPREDSREYQLILLSAKTLTALDKMSENLVEFLREHPHINLADAASTLHMGRRNFGCRRMTVCSDVDEALAHLSVPSAENVYTCQSSSADKNLSVVFLFPGQGAQYVNMGLDLYRTEHLFREEMDCCFEILNSVMGDDIKGILYPCDSVKEVSLAKIHQTEVTQPLLFVFEYCLAKLLMSWGITPTAMIGHSIGEYVAACLSGVFSLEDALKLVVLRGRLMQQMLPGAMLSVGLPEKELTPLLRHDLAVAAVNAPSLCVVSGPCEVVDAFQKELEEKGINTRWLHTSHAFHSKMMDPILKEFETEVGKIRLHPPEIPYISNVTGTRITIEEVTNPQYWSHHIRKTVRFADGVEGLLKEKKSIFLEIGPGNALGTLVKKILGNNMEILPGIVSLVRHPKENVPDNRYLLEKLGWLWLYGKKINWEAFYAREKRCRIPLPSYPFERQWFWLKGNPFNMAPHTGTGVSLEGKKPDVLDWLYIPMWKQVAPVVPEGSDPKGKSRCMVFLNDCAFVSRLLKHLQSEKKELILVKPGPGFIKNGNGQYTIDPRKYDHYDALFKELQAIDKLPLEIIHLWGTHQPHDRASTPDNFDEAQYTGFYSLVYLSNILSQIDSDEQFRIIVVTNDIYDITGEEILAPEKATVLGPMITINQECAGISCRSIDITLPQPGHPKEEKLIRQLLGEFKNESADLIAAYRNNQRWQRDFAPIKPKKIQENNPPLRKNGVYLITGGLGNIGFLLAKELAEVVDAKLVLTGHSQLPPEEEWSQWLTTQDKHDPVSEKIKKILKLRERGTDVLFFSADVADSQEMEKVIRVSEEQMGPINGIIHAAGIVGEESLYTLNELNESICQRQFQAKVHGLLTLETLFRDKQLDFCLLMSSIASLLGGLGLTSYSAANIFMDTFAAKCNRESPSKWISVNWDLWQAGENKKNRMIENVLGGLNITPKEGIDTFHNILYLDHNVNQVVISTGDLLSRLKRWAKINVRKESERMKPSSQKMPTSIQQFRSGLLNSYAPPRNQIERIITDILQKYFGFEQIGIHDNFFDLGATSMDLVQISSNLNAALGKKVPLVKMLAYPTVSSYANFFVEEVLGEKNFHKETNRNEVLERGKKNLHQKLNRRFVN